MATITQFEELEIWQEARRLNVEIYKLSCNSAFRKDFKFRDQIRAAAASVMDNIAEGFERSGRSELIQFLSVAKGSAGEVRSQLYRAIDQQYVETVLGIKLIDEYRIHASKIGGFINYLKSSDYKGQKFKNRNGP
jgi:four helix bundle protein